MFSRLVTRLTRFLLRSTHLSIADRGVLTSELLDKLAVLPIHDIIKFNEDGSIFANGHPLTKDEMIRFKEAAYLLVNNVAFKLIHANTERVAIVQGVHKAETDIQMLFSRAALYFSQQEMEMAKRLAQYPLFEEMD